MRCYKARNRLANYNWQVAAYGGDKELMTHLEKCVSCRSLVLAEQALNSDLTVVGRDKPEVELSFAQVKNLAEMSAKEKSKSGLSPIRNWGSIAGHLFALRRYRIAAAAVVAIGFLAFVPFNFQERAGFEIAIAGVDKSIAEDNTEITSLFCALGMEEDKSMDMNDSLNVNEIRLNVGECRETCYLTISDLKTEKDVAFVVKQILELGCCQIDKIVPIFRNESSSLLRHITRKLIS